MRRARRKDSKVKKRLAVFFASFFTVILAFFVVLGFHGVLFPIAEIGDEVIDESYVEPVDKATGKANVLILGVDKDGLRTDTIIVASYDLDANQINMLSIPRDTRMYIGGRYQKINAAHSLTQNGKIKGPQGSIEAVTRLTGIPINYYVEFSTSAFRNTIDALGGVDLYVPQRMKYSDPAQDLYIDLQEGYQHLDGDKAEQFVRFRKYPRGDIQRVEAQQSFVKALIEQKLNAGILTKIPDLFKTLQNDIDTNLTIMDAMKYLPNLKELSAENIHMYQLPGDFSGAEYEASYWLVNVTELKNLIANTFGYDASNITTGAKGKTDTEAAKSSKTTQTTETKKTTTEKKKTQAVPSKTAEPTATKMPDNKDTKATAEPGGVIEIPDTTAAPSGTAAPKATTTPKVTEKPETEKKEEDVKPVESNKQETTADTDDKAE